MRPEKISSTGFAAVVLAAQRRGVIDPLAEKAGLTHKCVVPIAGKPLIAHVVEALRATPGLARLKIVVEPEMAATLREELPDAPVAIEYVPAASNLADSVHAAAVDLDQPTIVTTADNVLLTPGAIEAMLGTLRSGAQVGIAMAARASVLSAHPDGQRRFYRFTDDEYSNCNLYAFAGANAFRAAESFRGGGQFAKKPMRLVAAIGPINVLLFLMGRLSLSSAMKRLSRRFRMQIRAVVLPDGAHAIDVDNERTFNVASQLLDARHGERVVAAIA
ncbi:NTP transferase domain-containing protein [Sphingomonas sp. PR090111-T3T-6A]|uniref:NTP transferase domain-containing protein n=1 Tax=Sphingomonas sp. PR090111-T3T-6A TaxID=685778 RepID=UPI0003663947|nr:NTP transferase domain-containing protein [Sphingomonas sp. PR090111-T3T-6A]